MNRLIAIGRAFCGAPADRIGFHWWEEGNKESMENPMLFCHECWEDPDKRKQVERKFNSYRFNASAFVSFFKLGTMTDEEIGRLCGKKNYHINHLATRIWKKRIFSIHYLSKPPRGKNAD